MLLKSLQTSNSETQAQDTDSSYHDLGTDRYLLTLHNRDSLKLQACNCKNITLFFVIVAFKAYAKFVFSKHVLPSCAWYKSDWTSCRGSKPKRHSTAKTFCTSSPPPPPKNLQGCTNIRKKRANVISTSGPPRARPSRHWRKRRRRSHRLGAQADQPEPSCQVTAANRWVAPSALFILQQPSISLSTLWRFFSPPFLYVSSVRLYVGIPFRISWIC